MSCLYHISSAPAAVPGCRVLENKHTTGIGACLSFIVDSRAHARSIWRKRKGKRGLDAGRVLVLNDRSYRRAEQDEGDEMQCGIVIVLNKTPAWLVLLLDVGHDALTRPLRADAPAVHFVLAHRYGVRLQTVAYSV